MNKEIHYDFSLSQSEIKNLEEISYALEKTVIREFENGARRLSSSWQGEAADEFMKKCFFIEENLKIIGKEIQSEAEQLRKVSRHMYLIEKQAEEAAGNSDTGGRY